MLPASGRMVIPGLNSVWTWGLIYFIGDYNYSVSVVALFQGVLDCHQLFL